jgi:RNA recognition motif-containing protein
METMTAIFVTNFSKHIEDEQLHWLFEDYGEVEEVNIWVDYAERSIRFAIVEMPDHKKAQRAIRKLDGKKFDGNRRLWVEEAPASFTKLQAVCADALSNQKHHWQPFKYRPHRISSSEGFVVVV